MSPLEAQLREGEYGPTYGPSQIELSAADRIATLETALRTAIAYCDDAHHRDNQYADERPHLLRVLGDQ